MATTHEFRDDKVHFTWDAMGARTGATRPKTQFATTIETVDRRSERARRGRTA